MFVYGTLMFPEVWERVVQTKSWGRPGVLNDYRRFKVNIRDIGNYPAIVPEKGATVTGLVMYDLTEEQVTQADHFEGVAAPSQPYFREQLTIVLDDETVQANAYVAGPGLMEYLGGPWDPIAFRQNELEHYLRLIDGWM